MKRLIIQTLIAVNTKDFFKDNVNISYANK